MYTHILKLIGFISLLILSGCSSLKRPTTPALSPEQAQKVWGAHQTKIHHIQNWKIEGRMAVRHAQEGESASLVWLQNGDYFKLQLFGPFGSGAVDLIGDNTHVVMHQNNKTFEAPTAEALLYQQLKWRLPLSHLNYWVRGIPAPDIKIDRLELDGEGHLRLLIQHGWRIEYEKYQPYGQEKSILPGRLHLKNPDLDVKLIVRKWGEIH